MKNFIILFFLLAALWGRHSAMAQYCIPTISTPCFSGTTNDFINNFSTSNAICNLSNNNSGCNGQADNYIHYSNLTMAIAPRQSFDIAVQSSVTYQQGFGIWIDWNDNQSFLDPGEFVWNSGVAGFNLFTGTIVVPSGVSLGIKRMRVRSNFAAPPNHPCNLQTYGEVEDYNIEVVNDSALSVPVVSDVMICYGDSASLVANGFGTINWYSSASGGTLLDSGLIYQTPPLYNDVVFYAQSMAGNCYSALVAVNVTVLPSPAAPVITQSGPELHSSPALSYQWFLNGAELPGDTLQMIMPLQNGDYTVSIVDSNGCSAASFPYTITNVGLSAYSGGFQIKAFPNPVSGQLTVMFSEETQGTIRISNAMGQMIWQTEVKQNSKQMLIDVGHFSPGLYFMQFGNSQTHQSKKFIKQ
jgi:hypothetical protein